MSVHSQVHGRTNMCNVLCSGTVLPRVWGIIVDASHPCMTSVKMKKTKQKIPLSVDEWKQ